MSGTFLNSATILSGASASGPIPLGNLTLLGTKISYVSGVNLTVQVSKDNGATFQNTFLDNAYGANANSAYSLAISANLNNSSGTYVMINPAATGGVDYIQFVASGAVANPVNFTLSLRTAAI